MDKPGKPVFSLRQGEPLPVDRISSQVQGADVMQVQHKLESTLVEHFQLFNQVPFLLAYDKTIKGYSIQSSPAIGLLDCGDFIIKLEPKFKGLEVGKCLQLAHYCQSNHLVKHSNSLIEDNMSGNEELNGPDYFAASFLSSLTDIINNGLLRTRSKHEGFDPDFKGTLLPDRHINKGATPLAPYTEQTAFSTDVPINRTLKSALHTIRQSVKNDKLQSIAAKYLGYFNDVVDLDVTVDREYTFSSTLRRADYEQGVALAKIIIEGFSPLSGDQDSFLPSFTLDLDRLFESFTAFELKKRILSDNFTVSIQSEFSHPTTPRLKDKVIIPDLVIRSSEENGKSIILDTKNKYSLLADDTTLSLSNADLYQISYYCLALKAETAILIYPGNKTTATKFPIKGSEGKEEYERKRTRAVEKIKSESSTYIKVKLADHSINLFFWRINLEGTLFDTQSSVAQLANFIVDSIKGKL